MNLIYYSYGVYKNNMGTEIILIHSDELNQALIS